MKPLRTILLIAGFATIAATSAFSANLLVNGDFTSGETGWSDSNNVGTVSSGVLSIAGGGSPDGNFSQAFAPQTGPTVVSFDFFTTNPGSGDRSMNIFLRESVGGGQINLRVITGGNVQIFQSGGPSWQTLSGLNGSVVTDGTTVNTFQLTFNAYGGSLDYDVTVNGSTETGVGFFQNTTLDDFSQFHFTNDFGATAFSADNVSVDPIPEPSAALLGLVALVGLLRRRR